MNLKSFTAIATYTLVSSLHLAAQPVSLGPGSVGPGSA
ncbi:MAG: hypothetical protein QOJ99_4895, partial [Bryobacterales bacterium]|nr:hypothetical protein [Bryobacterales bacterium]